MSSPIAKYFIRTLKNVKFREIPDFSPSGPISGMEVPTWGYFAEIRVKPLFFSPRGVEKIAISKIDSTNLLIMVVDNLENKKCYAYPHHKVFY